MTDTADMTDIVPGGTGGVNLLLCGYRLRQPSQILTVGAVKHDSSMRRRRSAGAGLAILAGVLLLTTNLVNGLLVLTDNGATNYPARFYRVTGP